MTKRTFTIPAAILLFAVYSYAQDTPSNLSLASLELDEKSFLQEQGFPITRYSFDSSEINKQLHESLGLRKKGRNLQTTGWIGMGAGLVLMFVPIGDGTQTIGQVRVIGGAGLTLTGLTLNLIGNGKKQKARKKVQNATYLYTSKD